MAENVIKRGNYWVADYLINGKRKQRRVPNAEAGWQLIEREKRQLVIDLDQQQRTGIKTAPAAANGRLSLTEAFDLSMERRFKGQAQIQNIESHWKKIRSYFGPNTQLSAISAIWLDEFRQHLLKKVKAVAVNRTVSVLRAMRSDAITFGRLISVPTWPPQLTESKIPPRFLSGDEVDAMLAYFHTKTTAMEGNSRSKWNQMADLMQFRLCQGSRFYETVRITPRDVNWTTGDITFWKTKNGSPRTVPLLANALEIVQRRSTQLETDQRIFNISYRAFSEHWKEAVEALGLPGRVVGHTTRHTMATRAVSSNIATTQLMHFGGWKSLSALQLYSHIDTQGLQSMKKALEQY